MKEYDFLNGSLNIKNGIDCIKQKIEFRKEHPEYFDPAGLITFCR